MLRAGARRSAATPLDLPGSVPANGVARGNPPSPVREEPDAGRSEAREGASERSEPGGGGGASVSQLRAENAKLRGNVSQLEAKTKLLDKDGPARVAFAGGFTLVHVLVIAILAFLLGRFT